jgi:2-polyprenyl-6-methoxyphenol hydroxylase-like FAD-dependent oxidoreductase
MAAQRPPDQVTIAATPPTRMTVLSGKRLIAAAREPFVSLWTAAQQRKLPIPDLVSKRAAALFRIPQTRTAGDYITVLSAQLRELEKLPPDSAGRICTALPNLTKQIAAVLRSLTTSATVTTDAQAAEARLLSQTAQHFPELAAVADAARATATKLAQLPRVPALVPPARARPGSRVQTAVVAGAGPAGLAASIELLMRGVHVDLVDARDPWEYTRPVQMVVKVRALDQLARLGVLDRLRPHISRIRSDIDHGPGFVRTSPIGNVRDGDHLRATRSGGDFAKSPSVYIISMHELETALFERALELGVRTIAHASIDIHAPSAGSDRHGVVAHRGMAHGKSFVSNGEMIPLGIPDLIVVAEGSQTERREQFGISWDRDTCPPKRGLAGLVNVDIGPESRTWSESPTAHRNAVMSVGHATSGATWSLVEVPTNEVVNNSADAKRIFLQRAGRALGKKLENEDLLFGGATLFPIENRIASSALFFASNHQAVVAVGDAKGLGSPEFGLGMQYGISVDAINLGRFVDNVDVMGFATAGAILSASVRDSVKIWHRLFT